MPLSKLQVTMRTPPVAETANLATCMSPIDRTFFLGARNHVNAEQ